MKRILALLLAVFLLSALTGCASKELTLEQVVKLSEKGEALSWEDFAQYPYQETGSGVYIRLYSIDDTFELLIGGPHPEEDPWYIHLREKAQHSNVDIRTGDVTAFIQKIRGA